MPAYEAYGQNYNAYGSFFPNAQEQERQRKLNAPRLQPNQLTTYQIPGSGTVTVRAGSKVPDYYQRNNLAVPYVPPANRSTVQNQAELNQVREQGYAIGNAPSPSIQQGAGGPYRIAGGVANPISQPPGFFGRLGRDISTIGTFAANLFNQGRSQNYSAYMPNYNTTGFASQQPSYSGGGYANTGPRRYFDF